MIEPQQIRPGMRVITPDGQRIGNVDEADKFGLKLARDSTSDGQHHYVAADLIERVDGDTVHLNRRAMAIMHGQARGGGRGAIDRRHLIPWLLAGLLALLVLILLLKDRDHDAAAPVATSDNTAAQQVTAPVALPNGRTVELAPNTLPYDVQAYLASQEAAPQTFDFDRLNFDSGQAKIRSEDREDLDNLARVLAAYPNARVRIVGYTDSRNGELPNQQLGYERARSVAKLLADKGVDENRIETISGGENNPVASNATGAGRFENRRTELIVLNR